MSCYPIICFYWTCAEAFELCCKSLSIRFPVTCYTYCYKYITQIFYLFLFQFFRLNNQWLCIILGEQTSRLIVSWSPDKWYSVITWWQHTLLWCWKCCSDMGFEKVFTLINLLIVVFVKFLVVMMRLDPTFITERNMIITCCVLSTSRQQLLLI